MLQGFKNSRSLRGEVLDLDSGGWGAGAKRRYGLVEQVVLRRLGHGGRSITYTGWAQLER